MIGENFIE